MSHPNYKTSAGLRNVGSYQIAGHPFVTGSTIAAGKEFNFLLFQNQLLW